MLLVGLGCSTAQPRLRLYMLRKTGSGKALANRCRSTRIRALSFVI